MNSAEKQAVLHCLKSMIDEEVCEECPLYGTTGADHCEEDCVRLAIKALEQEPCGNCINRQAVFDIVEKAPFKGDALSEIEDLPSVTPQPKMGRWIRVDKDKCRCDQCEVISFIAVYPNGDKNYCPNCGAKMQEVEG